MSASGEPMQGHDGPDKDYETAPSEAIPVDADNAVEDGAVEATDPNSDAQLGKTYVFLSSLRNLSFAL